MLNTYHLSIGFVITSLAGILLYYSFVDLPAFMASTEAKTLELLEHSSRQVIPDFYAEKNSTEFKIVHRGSGRIVPISL